MFFPSTPEVRESSFNFICRASNMSNPPLRVFRMSVITFIASLACIVPIRPGITSITPPSAQDGTSSCGGGSGLGLCS